MSIIYVDSTLAADTVTYNVGTRSGTGGSATAKKTIASASAAAVSGTTVSIRAGTYAAVIHPVASGTAEDPIIYESYGAEVVTVTGASIGTVESGDNTSNNGDVLGIYIFDHHYITIQNLHFEDTYWARIVNTTYVTLLGNTFLRSGGTGTRAGVKFLTYRTPNNTPNAAHESHDNRILNNTIYDGNDSFMLIHSDNNLVEGNTMTKARHNVWSVYAGNGNILRNNYFGNPDQKIGQITDAEGDRPYQTDATKYNVIENNVFNVTGDSGNASPFAGIQFAAQNTIVRYNRFYHTVGPAIQFTLYADEAQYNYGNRVYNNVFDNTDFAALEIQDNGAFEFSDNIFKNNIFSNSVFVVNDTRWPFYTNVISGMPVQVMTSILEGFVFEKNNFYSALANTKYLITHGDRDQGILTTVQEVSWWNANYPALFINNTVLDPEYVDVANHDYHLQAGSPLISSGVFLAQTVGAGSGTSMTVTDAGYFHDGFGIVGETGDSIQLDGGVITAHVTEIDYSTNVLTLDTSLTWSNGQGVSLAYNGDGPDIGAFKYESPAPEGGTRTQWTRNADYGRRLAMSM